jgi:transposase
MTAEILGAIWVRLGAGDSQRDISGDLGLDKKTVNQYAAKIRAAGIPSGTTLAQALPKLEGLLDGNRKESPAMAALEPYRDEILSLISGDRATSRQPMKAKTAWMVIKELHHLEPKTSYESFKRFCRKEGLKGLRAKPVARIETEPGKEAQLDYAKMGMWEVSGQRRTVYSYLGILAASRLPFIEFCTSQDQASFAESTQRLFQFHGGAVERLNLDNLKAGVLAADIYDPVINRSFAELCDHYGVIPDPARPVTPTDKGKVERFVQVARELWRRLTALHPQATLDELNALARAWCLEEYGLSIHGTTALAPLDAFLAAEKPRLKALPALPFEVASWSTAKVARDQFVTVQKARYGVPASFIGEVLGVRATATTVELFHEHKSVRAYVKSGASEHFLAADFPAFSQPFEPGAYSKALRANAAALGPQAARYIDTLLKDDSQVCRRRATACLALLERNAELPGLSHAIAVAMAEGLHAPARLQALLADESFQKILPFPVSDHGMEMVRGADYYVKP